MSNFKQKVIKAVNLIPYGKVASYGQIAALVGVPRGARQVGWILNSLEHEVEVPWWRVINNAGRISIKGSEYSALDQKELLEKEDIVVNDDFTLDIEKYRFIPDSSVLSKLELPQEYVLELMEKYNL